MGDRNEALVREAYRAYCRGDVAGMLEFVHPALEWTYLDPAFEDPEPETCRGRDQLRAALERQAGQGLAWQIEEIAASGDTVMVVICTPGVDRVRVRQSGDRDFFVLTLDHERIVKMRACRNRAEARNFAGITGPASAVLGPNPDESFVSGLAASPAWPPAGHLPGYKRSKAGA